MNERLVAACLRLAAATTELQAAQAEVEAARTEVTAVVADKLGAQVKTAPGGALTPESEGLADQALGAID